MYCNILTTIELEIHYSFMMLSSKVLKHIKNSKGIVNHAVKANFAKKFFWTLSIWNDKKSIRLFVPAEPHATAIKRFTQWAGDDSAFVEVAHSLYK